MGSTNKTQYLELPQWIGTDQPTWLGDMNDAFLKIDNGYNTIGGNASSAISQAGAAVQTANNAKEVATTANTNATEANENATTALQTANAASQTANTALSTANNALEKITENENKNVWVGGAMTPNTTLIDNTSVGFCYYNAYLNIFNVYVYLTGKNNSGWTTAGTHIFTLPSNVVNAIKTNRTIYGGLICQVSNGTTMVINVGLSTSGGNAYIDVSETFVSGTYPSQGSMQLMLNTSQW